MNRNTKNIVFFGLQPWDIKIGSNAKSMAMELAKEHFVLYINRPLDRISQIKKQKDPIVQNRLRVIRGEVSALQQVEPNLWVYTPPIVVESIQRIPFYSLFQLMNKINNRRLAKSIKSVLKQLEIKNYILMNDSSMFLGYYLKEMLKPQQYVYYIRDYLIAQPYFKKYGPKAEARLIQKVDHVVCNSSYLAEYAKQFRKDAHYIGQGCDLENFDLSIMRSSPKGFPLLDGPIIGYVGSLTSKRLDLSLLEQLVQKQPEWNFVFVGPEDEAFLNSPLHQMENAYFLGFQPMDQLANYIEQFDVCINPQLLNQICIGNYPRKVDEYLAMGKAVVVSETITMQSFEPYVYLANGVEGYVEKIAEALEKAEPTQIQERVKFAQSHSWEASIDAIWEVID